MNAPKQNVSLEYAPVPPRDFSRYARAGFVACAVALGVGGLAVRQMPNPLALLPLAVAILLPRLGLPGWFLAWIVGALLLVGNVTSFVWVRMKWSMWSSEAPGAGRFLLSMYALGTLAAVVTLWALLMPGTRQAMQARSRGAVVGASPSLLPPR